MKSKSLNYREDYQLLNNNNNNNKMNKSKSK